VPDERLWAFLLGGWFLLGFAYSMAVTPTGRLLRQSANPEDRPAYERRDQLAADFGQARARDYQTLKGQLMAAVPDSGAKVGEDPGQPRFVGTVRGVGYRLVGSR